MSSYINQLAKRKQSHGRVWACVILCSINMHLEKILFTITTKWHEKELYAFVVITLKSKDEQPRRVTVKPSQHEHTFIFSFAFINSASKKRPWPISANLNVLTYIKIKEEKKKDSTEGYLANPSLLLLQVAEVIPVIMLGLLTCLTKKLCLCRNKW